MERNTINSKRKRIVHFLYSGLGGHASVFFSLMKADAYKYFEYGGIFCGVENIRPEYINKCNKYAIPYLFILKKRGFDFAVYWKILKGFFILRGDIIFLHGSNFILPAFLCKIFRFGKTSIVIRDTQAHHLKSKTDWFWLKVACWLTDRFIFLTPESLADVHVKRLRAKLNRKSVTIPNGLDIEKYKPVSKEFSSNNVIIGMQSRLQSIKDHPTLLHAFRILKERNPGINLLLRIAGEGETMEALKEMARTLGIDENVEFCGMLLEDELISFMNSLDIYVHATLGETMSNSIMQAMACGLPVLASDVWGVNNMIAHNENGLLFPHKDANALASLLDDLIRKQGEREKLAHAARDFAEENYSLDIMFARYKTMFASL